MLYIKFPVRVIIGLYLASGLLMLAVTIIFLIVDTFNGDESQNQTLFSVFYQICINGPTILFMVPLFVYIGVLETFLANNYPSIYNNSGLFLTSNNVN